MGVCCSKKSDIIPDLGRHTLIKQGRLENDIQDNQILKMDNNISYKICKKLGEGSFGVVYLIENKDKKDDQFALKIIQSEDSNIQEMLIKEYENLSQQQDRCIIRFYDMVKFDCSKSGLIMEYANQGSLEEFLENPFKHSSKYGAKLGANHLIDITTDIFQGLIALHSKKIIHRDLKPENILLSNFTAKIGDLGASKQVQEYTIKTQSIVGNILYAAPEKIKENEYSVQSDIYSIGLIVLELFFRLNKKDILKFKIKKQPIQQLINAPLSLQLFIEQGLLNIDPAKRISSEKAILILRQLKQQQEVLDYINSFYQIKQVIPFESMVTSYLMSTDLQEKKFNVVSQYLQEQQGDEAKQTAKQIKNQKIKDALQLYFDYLFDSSFILFQDILQENPGSSYGIVGCCLNFLKMFDQYGKDIDLKDISEKLESVKQQDPQQALTYFAFTQLALINDNYEDALQNIQACIDVGDEMIQAEALALNAFILYKLNKDMRQVQQLINKAISTKFYSSFILFYQALIQTKQDLKLSQLNKALEMCGQNYDSILVKGDIYLDEGNLDQAEQEYKKSLSINSNLKYSLIQLANCYHQQKQYSSCIKFIQDKIHRFGEQIEFYIILGDCYFGVGSLDEALMNYLLYSQSIMSASSALSFLSMPSSVIKNNSDYSLSHSYKMIGFIYLLQNQVDNALQQFYIGAINNGISCLFSLYKFYQDINNMDRANKLLEVIISLHPEHYKDSIIKAISYRELKKMDKFYSYVKQLRIKFPNKSQINELYISQLFYDQRYKEVTELAEDMFIQNTITPKVLRYQIHSFLNQDQLMFAFRKLIEIIPPEMQNQQTPISALENIFTQLKLEQIDPENRLSLKVLYYLYETNPEKYYYNCFLAKFLNGLNLVEESSKVLIYYDNKIDDIEYYRDLFYLQVYYFDYYLKIYLQNDVQYENVFKFHLQKAILTVQFIFSEFLPIEIYKYFPQADNALQSIQEIGQKYLDNDIDYMNNNNNQNNYSQIHIIESVPKSNKLFELNDMNFISEILSSQLPLSEN